ncbi:molybdenum cofactor guanylyltransferase [Persephonella sp.]
MQRLSERITAVLLAGGQSKRMGTDKAFLKLGGETFIRIIARKLSIYCSQIVVSGNKEENLYLKEIGNVNTEVIVVRDRDPFTGPLNGIASVTPFVKHRLVFVATCDTPLLEPQLIPFFAEKIEEKEAVIPVIGEKLQFLNTLYTKEALKKSESVYNKGTKSLHKWVEGLDFIKVSESQIKPVDRKLFSYWSINTQEDFKRLKVLWGEGYA